MVEVVVALEGLMVPDTEVMVHKDLYALLTLYQKEFSLRINNGY